MSGIVERFRRAKSDRKEDMKLAGMILMAGALTSGVVGGVGYSIGMRRKTGCSCPACASCDCPACDCSGYAEACDGCGTGPAAVKRLVTLSGTTGLYLRSVATNSYLTMNVDSVTGVSTVVQTETPDATTKTSLWLIEYAFGTSPFHVQIRNAASPAASLMLIALNNYPWLSIANAGGNGLTHQYDPYILAEVVAGTALLIRLGTCYNTYIGTDAATQDVTCNLAADSKDVRFYASIIP